MGELNNMPGNMTDEQDVLTLPSFAKSIKEAKELSRLEQFLREQDSLFSESNINITQSFSLLEANSDCVCHRDCDLAGPIVCASNYQIYDNECRMKMDACQTKQSLKVVQYSQCEAHHQEDPLTQLLTEESEQGEIGVNDELDYQSNENNMVEVGDDNNLPTDDFVSDDGNVNGIVNPFMSAGKSADEDDVYIPDMMFV